MMVLLIMLVTVVVIVPVVVTEKIVRPDCQLDPTPPPLRRRVVPRARAPPAERPPRCDVPDPAQG